MTWQMIYALIKRVISRHSNLEIHEIFADDQLSNFYTSTGLLGFASALNSKFADNGTFSVRTFLNFFLYLHVFY